MIDFISMIYFIDWFNFDFNDWSHFDDL